MDHALHRNMQPDTIALKPQTLNSRARTVGVNLNYWFPVGWGDRLKPGQVQQQIIWQQQIAVYRGADGVVRAMDNRCLHKGVSLHKGEVIGNELVCPYHGWRFRDTGHCVDIPYLKDPKKLPKQALRTYPVQERYNLIWIFPGNKDLSKSVDIPEVPEYHDPNWLIVEIPADFKVHFSVVNENPLDVFHGHLHRDLQGWYAPVLVDLKKDSQSLQAGYEVTYKNGWLPRLLGLTHSKEPEIQCRIDVGYHYPHCRNQLQGKSSYYFMRQPEGPESTRSYALLCLKIRLPGWLVKCMRKPLSRILSRFLVKPFLDQDIEVMESEQMNFCRDPHRRQVEINPVIVAAQALTVKQYDSYLESEGR